MPVSTSSSNKPCQGNPSDSACYRSAAHARTILSPFPALKSLAVSLSLDPPNVARPSSLLPDRVFLSHSASVTSAFLRSLSFASSSFLRHVCLFRPPLLPTLVRLEQSSSTNLSQALAEPGVFRSADGMRVTTPISAAFSGYIYIYTYTYIYVYIYILYIYIGIYVYISVQVCLSVGMYLCMYVCMYVCM